MIITIDSTIKDDIGNSYCLTDILGEGGFGYVFKARRESDGTNFAVKTLHNSFVSEDMYLSFQKETNQSKLIDSENVIHYSFIHDGTLFPELPPYIIMEYTDGGTLRNLINKQQGTFFDNRTLIDMFLQLAKGMDAISRQLVHRDIKPENILNFNGTLKITDFGLSKLAGESTKTMSFKGGGTPLYIAPEAWNNDRNTIQMDIYSMGIVFYELATLGYPYPLPSRNDWAEYKNMHLFKGANNPSRINRTLPPHIVSVIIKMLEKSVNNRFKSWGEIISAIESEPQPEDDISKYVSRAITLQNEGDLKRQLERADAERKENEKKDHIAFAYSQFENTVLAPIQEFADRFNAQYPGDSRIRITYNPPSGTATRFNAKIITPIQHTISIFGEILFKENFTRDVPRDRVFYPGQTMKVNYLPQYENRDIILWCQVSDYAGLGFNILLVKNADDMYGEWVVLDNSDSGFSNKRRQSPFGFELSELPKEVYLIHCLHIYNIQPSPYSKEKMLDFISTHI